MTLQRGLGLLLIIVEAGALGYLMRTAAFPVTVVAVALLGAVSTKSFVLSRQRSVDASAVLGMLFLAKYLIAPPDLQHRMLFIRSQLALSVAQYVIALQALQFFVKREHNRLPVMLPGMGVIAMVCTAVVHVNRQEREVFQLLAMTFTVVSALYFGACRRPLVKPPTPASGSDL